VGKTRLAVQYALQSQADYCALLFVIGDTRESLRRNLAALCGPMILNLPERDAMEEDIRIAAVLRWLHEHPGWLLILDNVDTRAAAAEVERLLPQFHAGHVLITSCISDWSGSIEPLELDVLSEEDSVAFLLEKTRDRRRATPNDDADARALARQLGGLAVALQQAGAFISQLRVSLADYLRRWRKREAKVLTWHDERLMKYPRSVAVTWDTTSAQLDAPARALLRILCWFAPEPIPRAVLETEATEQALVVGAEWLRASGDLPQADPAQARVEDALAALAGFSLLKWERGNDALHIHRLVEEVTRDRLAEEERQFWLRAALRVANAYLVSDPPPHDVRSWSRWEPLRAHVAAIISAAEAANITSPTGRLMNELGLLLHVKCVWNEAEALYRRAVILAERSFGPDNPQVATCLNNLASLLQATNRLEESESLYRRTLVIDERNLGPDHPTVATHLNNLAQLLQITNRREEAEPLMWRVLAISEHSFGRDHPKVTVGLNNLASLLQDMNRPEEAEVLYRRALAIDEKHLGSSHPNVATGLNNLASLLQATNRMGEAESLYRRGLAIDEQTLGPGHFNVARDLSNLAWLLSVTGRPGEAEPLMWRALAIDESVFGPNHPTVAVRLNNLAMLLQATNRLAEAEPLMRRHLEILLELSAAAGSDYPHLLAGVKNYSALVTQMGCSPDEVLARITAIAQPFGISFASGAGAE
jgi:tetratricopeptide (TPR) repeat protein